MKQQQLLEALKKKGFLTQAQAADFAGYANPRSYWRARKNGKRLPAPVARADEDYPHDLPLGNRVIYRYADLYEWAEACDLELARRLALRKERQDRASAKKQAKLLTNSDFPIAEDICAGQWAFERFIDGAVLNGWRILADELADIFCAKEIPCRPHAIRFFLREFTGYLEELREKFGEEAALSDLEDCIYEELLERVEYCAQEIEESKKRVATIR